MDNIDGATEFEVWLREVDAVYGRVLGMGMDDLGDAPWYDYWSDELTPREAVAHALIDWQDMDFDMLDSLGLGGLV